MSREDKVDWDDEHALQEAIRRVSRARDSVKDELGARVCGLHHDVELGEVRMDEIAFLPHEPYLASQVEERRLRVRDLAELPQQRRGRPVVPDEFHHKDVRLVRDGERHADPDSPFGRDAWVWVSTRAEGGNALRVRVDPDTRRLCVDPSHEPRSAQLPDTGIRFARAIVEG